MIRKSSAFDLLLLVAQRVGVLVPGCSHIYGVPYHKHTGQAEVYVDLVAAQEQAHALVAASALARGQGRAKAAPTPLA